MTSFETLAENVDADVASEHVVANDVRLHVVTAGPEDGDVVVLLHGFPEFWYSWRKQIPALADAGYRVVVPDMRGYNESEKPRGVDAYRIDRLVADVVALVEHYADDASGVDATDDASDAVAADGGDASDAAAARDDAGDGGASAHVVGHDWGGAVAWSVAIREPAVVDRLAIMNAPHPGRFRELLRRPAQLKRSWYMFAFQLPALPEFGLTRDDAAVLDELFRDSMPAGERQHYRDALKRPGAARAAVNYYRAFMRLGVRDELPFLSPSAPTPAPTVAAPTLVVWGDDDEALLSANADGLDRWVPDLRVERITGASHWVQVDAPERVNDELRAHLAAN
jgi:pimeloyl-ACP methyl ester carboxylesterase